MLLNKNLEVHIKDVIARRVFDSQGFATIEVEIETEDGISASASVPRGSTKGGFETCYVENYSKGIKKSPDISKAIENVESIIKPALVGKVFRSICELDELLISLDSDEQKRNIGGNCTLATSYAMLKLVSKILNLQMYEVLGDKSDKVLPMINVIDGSKHPQSKLVGVEVLLVPVQSRWSSVGEIIEKVSNIVVNLKELMIRDHYIVEVSKQGALSILIDNIEGCLEYVNYAIQLEGYELGLDFMIGLDLAVTDYYDINENVYNIPWAGDALKDNDLLELYTKWISKYNVIYIEDGFADSDYIGWKKFIDRFGSKIMISGDDLFATNLQRLKQHNDIANTAVVKPNQIGTLLETIKFINECKTKNVCMVVSQRTGETEDVIITHLAVAFGLSYLKAGGIYHMDRMAKFNELIRIYE